MAGSIGPGWTGPVPAAASSSAEDNEGTIDSMLQTEGFTGSASTQDDERGWEGDVDPKQPIDPDPGNTFEPGSVSKGIGPGSK